MSSKLSGTPTSTSNPSKNNRNFSARVPGVSGNPAILGPERKKLLTAFSKTLGLKFRNAELLNLAFIHRSVSNESGPKVNNERLEFLGDSVLGTVAAKLLYEKFNEKPEGELAKIKSVVVSEDILSGVALEIQIDSLLVLGKGEEISGGRVKKAILADALEALIGALYLDSGFEAAFSFVSGFLNREISRVLEDRYYRDYKSLLQEFTQKFYRSYPVYRLVKRSGPEHERMFWVEVTVNDRSYGPGTGRNKKGAEQEAARMAMDALEGSA